MTGTIFNGFERLDFYCMNLGDQDNDRAYRKLPLRVYTAHKNVWLKIYMSLFMKDKFIWSQL